MALLPELLSLLLPQKGILEEAIGRLVILWRLLEMGRSRVLRQVASLLLMHRG